MKKLFLFSLTLLAFLVSACGGDNDNNSNTDDFVGAASVKVSIRPNKIDTGDRARVSIEVSGVHPDGILLKVLFSDGLSFVPNTSVLLIDRSEKKITPKFEESADEGNYLVFLLSQRDFLDTKGRVEFELTALEPMREGRVEVDADVNDKALDDGTEFDVENPLFTAESEATITVNQ